MDPMSAKPGTWGTQNQIGDVLPGLKPLFRERSVPQAKARGFYRRPAAQDLM